MQDVSLPALVFIALSVLTGASGILTILLGSVPTGRSAPVRESRLRRQFELAEDRPWPGLESWHDALDARRRSAGWSRSEVCSARQDFLANVVREDC